MKRKLIIILAVVLLVGVSLGLYFYFRNKEEKTEVKIEGKLSESVMQIAKLSPDKKWINYYSTQQTPAFYRQEIASKKIEQISGALASIEEINFAPDLTKVGFRVTYDQGQFEKYGSPFLEPKMPDGEKRFWIYDFENKKLSYLSPNVISYTFSTDSQKIYYLFASNEGKLSINQAKFDGTNFEKIVDWPYGEPRIKAVDDNKILVAYSTEEFESQGDGLYELNIKDKKLANLTNQDFSNFFVLSPSKKIIFYYLPIFERDKTKSSIWITDLAGKNKSGYLKIDEEVDFQNVVWSKDEKTLYFAAKSPDQDNFDKIYRYRPEEKTVQVIISQDKANSMTVDINDNGDTLYYLLNSELYGAKI